MSLFDTIQGARAEAEANRDERSKKEEAAQESKPADEDEKKGGFAKRSVARAKPAREAAANVRVVNSSGKTKRQGSNVSAPSKEQRKAERDRERDEQDRADAVAQILLESEPTYKPKRRIWWILIGGGFVAMAGSLIPMAINSDEAQNYGSALGMFSVVCMILAYILIIGAFVYDFARIRPMRKQSQRTAAGMTRKTMQKVLDDDRRQRLEARAAKEAKKK